MAVWLLYNTTAFILSLEVVIEVDNVSLIVHTIDMHSIVRRYFACDDHNNSERQFSVDS